MDHLAKAEPSQVSRQRDAINPSIHNQASATAAAAAAADGAVLTRIPSNQSMQCHTIGMRVRVKCDKITAVVCSTRSHCLHLLLLWIQHRQIWAWYATVTVHILCWKWRKTNCGNDQMNGEIIHWLLITLLARFTSWHPSDCLNTAAAGVCRSEHTYLWHWVAGLAGMDWCVGKRGRRRCTIDRSQGIWIGRSIDITGLI